MAIDPTFVPINKTAARVLGRGVHWEPAKKLIRPTDAWQESPLPTCQNPTAPSFIQLAGQRVGRVKIIGYGGSRGAGTGGARWVVRCSCGMFGHMSTKFLRSENGAKRAMCLSCDYLEQMKAGRHTEVPLRSPPELLPTPSAGMTDETL